MENDGGSPIDAKYMPGATFIGAILMVVGMAVFFFAVYSLVMWGLGEYSSFGLFGSILVMMLAVAIIAIGSIFTFAGIFRRIFGRRGRRILY